MPLIHAIVKESAKREITALDLCREDIRAVLAEITGHNIEDIAVIPRILSSAEERLSDNMLPLHLVIDLGVRPIVGFGDSVAENFMAKLCVRCSYFQTLTFGVWLRRHTSNSYAEREPHLKPVA